MKDFSFEKLTNARKAAGYTQKSFGEALGIAAQHVQQWEYGKKQPTAKYLLNAMELLNCAPADLLADEPD